MMKNNNLAKLGLINSLLISLTIAAAFWHNKGVLIFVLITNNFVAVWGPIYLIMTEKYNRVFFYYMGLITLSCTTIFNVFVNPYLLYRIFVLKN